MDCIFCKIIKGNLPALKVYQDNAVVAFLDIAPISPGHLLVVPRQHAADLLAIDDLALAYVMRVAKQLGRAMIKGLGADGFNVGINNGAVAGQVIEHFHCHVIPRFKNDGLKDWPAREYEPGQSEQLAAKLKAAL